MSVDVAHGVDGQSATINLLQNPTSSHRDEFIAQEFRLLSDGSMTQIRVPLRLKPRDPGLPTDFTSVPADMNALNTIFDLALLGDRVDESSALRAIDQFYGTVAAIHSHHPPYQPDEASQKLVA